MIRTAWEWERIGAPLGLPELIGQLNQRMLRLANAIKRPIRQTLTASGAVDPTTISVWADATAGAVTVTLPVLATAYQRVTVSKRDASGNAVTVDGNGTETIDGAANLPLAARYDIATFIPGPTEWAAQVGA